jgi:hypothetical protein
MSAGRSYCSTQLQNEEAMMKAIFAVCLSLGLALPAAASKIVSSVDPAELSESRQTPLGLYLTVEDAAAALAYQPSE